MSPEVAYVICAALLTLPMSGWVYAWWDVRRSRQTTDAKLARVEAQFQQRLTALRADHEGKFDQHAKAVQLISSEVTAANVDLNTRMVGVERSIRDAAMRPRSVSSGQLTPFGKPKQQG